MYEKKSVYKDSGIINVEAAYPLYGRYSERKAGYSDFYWGTPRKIEARPAIPVFLKSSLVKDRKTLFTIVADYDAEDFELVSPYIKEDKIRI